jgi:hypothetical protein
MRRNNEAGSIRMTPRRVLFGLGLTFAAVTYLDHIIDLDNPKYKRKEDTALWFSVSTSQGQVDCWGKIVEPLPDNDSVGGLVDRNTERIPNSNQTAIPPLKPIVNHVLKLNHIVDPRMVPPGTLVTRPEYCVFGPK